MPEQAIPPVAVWGYPPTIIFWMVSGISGLAGDLGIKVLNVETLLAKYLF
jgi:hypothetical protein